MPSFIPSFRIASANPEPQGCSTCYWHRDEYCGQITSEDLVLIMNSWGQWNRSLPWCSPLQSLIDGSCQGCRLITAHGRSREKSTSTNCSPCMARARVQSCDGHVYVQGGALHMNSQLTLIFGFALKLIAQRLRISTHTHKKWRLAK